MKSQISVLVLLGCAVAAAERHPWAGFLPGSYARWKTVTRSGGNESIAEVKQTVISVGLYHAVLETETLYGGRLVRTRAQVPLRAETPPLPLGKIVTLAKETVIVESRAVSAVCYESFSEVSQGRASERSCLSEEVPGRLVRSMIRLDGVESSTELLAFGVH
ncbi:MAG: hypothetical protein FJW38_30070 [Acidobacteria bacterium]|nr:hypothetical protein [Acidobacteriota bacterium]